MRACLRRDHPDDELAEGTTAHIDLRRRAVIKQGWPAREAAAERSASSATSPPYARRRAVTFVIRKVLKPVVIGLFGGLPVSAPAARVLGAVLYGVGPFGPLTFTRAVGLLAAAVVFAAWLPARRAASVDPLLALRSE